MENKLQKETKLLKIVIKQQQSVTKNPEGVNNKNMDTKSLEKPQHPPTKTHKTTTKRHSRSLTTMNGRTNGDVAHLRVEGELVDVHFAGADHLHVLLRRDRPVVRHVHVGILRGLVFLYPDTSY